MRDFTRKFTIKKAEGLIILNAVKEAGVVKDHILFNELSK